MRLLLDTQLLVWIPLGDRRITRIAAEAITDPANSLHVSAVVAFEFTDLQTRRRFPVHESIDFLAAEIGFDLYDLPAEGWRIAQSLPDIHRDPVDRMLIAHTIVEGFTLVTADVNIRRYPVETLW